MICEPASGEQLRRLWQNLKTRQRDALTRERQHRMATGGGGPCPDAEINPNIAEISPALFVEIRHSLDSDCIVSDLVSLNQMDQEYNTEPGTPSSISIQSQPLLEQPQPDSQPHTSNTNTHGTQPHTSSTNTVGTQPTPWSSCNTQGETGELSMNEKKLRVQILKNEYLNRERRASQLHKLQVKFMEEKHKLEIAILKESLKEAAAKAESAHKNL